MCLCADLSDELEDLSKLDPTAKPKYWDQAKLLHNCKLLLVQASAHQHLAQQVEASWEGSKGKQAHLSAALKGYEAACKLDKVMLIEPRPSGLGESLAEAALKLALLCKELLQVSSAEQVVTAKMCCCWALGQCALVLSICALERCSVNCLALCMDRLACFLAESCNCKTTWIIDQVCQ